MTTAPAASAGAGLVRGASLRAAVALNMIDMIGVGPFITLPLMVQAMGGPQAMLGWIAGALFAACDGMIWAELAAAFPQAGGSYVFLRECYGPRWGRRLSFLYIWQLTFSAPLSIASGCIGLSLYAAWLWPVLARPWYGRLFAMAACGLAVLLLYRGIAAVARISQWLWLGVAATVGWVVVAALTNFHAGRAFDFPAHAFTLSGGFWLGLGSAMLIASYDYWGYYNAAFLGGEIERPDRNLPRAILISIAIVAAIYIAMNIGVLGVLPWRELAAPGAAQTPVFAVFMQRIYGNGAARVAAALVGFTAFASVFALLLSYSRVPYAAALDGNFFPAFAKLHPRGRFPHVSLLALGAMAALFCCFSLKAVIAALVVIRIGLQFLLQAVGLLLLRRRGTAPRPWRMPFYPWPVWAAIAGFVYVLLARTQSWQQLALAGLIAVTGVGIYQLRPRAGEAKR